MRRSEQRSLFVGGQVFDGKRYAGPLAVLVEAGRIVAVDDARTLESEARDAERVDLKGGLLAPGFHDAHMHPVLGGLERLRCELYDLSHPEQYIEAILEHRARQSGHEWFRGGGWSVTSFGPHGPAAAELDRVLPQQPAFLPSSDHHNAWVNSEALRICGIDEHTADPPDGWIERDASGRPTGTLREAAMALVGDRVSTSSAEYYEGLLEAQQYLWSVGITGWHDALVGGYAGIDDPTPAYLRAIAAGTLRSHVRGSLWWDRHRSSSAEEIAAQAEELVVRRHELGEAGLDAGSVKVMVDGIAETFTATVGTGYRDGGGCPCGDHGLPFLSREALQETAVAVDRAGFQLHFHAIGDQAVHDALDAVEAARRRNGMNDRRHHIAHLQLVRPGDRPRFRRLGVVANLEGMWASADDPAVQAMVPHRPREQAAWHYPFADIVRTGGAVSGGSDWPVNHPDPVAALHVLVNRRSWTGSTHPSEPLVPEQALTLETAFAAYTSGSAHVNHRPHAGALQVGNVADLVVLDPDPFLGRDDHIGATQVVSTWIAGDRVV